METPVLLVVVVLVAILSGASAQQDTCQASSVFLCSPDWDYTQYACPSQCMWCPSVTPKCQTPHLSCIPSNRVLLNMHTTKTSCEASGNDWCGGRYTQQCVERQVISSLCFKNSGLVRCPAGDEASCNMAGCLWCNDGPLVNRNSCFQRESSGTGVCPSSNTCCSALRCKTTFTPASCTQAGCNYCIDADGVTPRCNFVTPTNLPTCPTGSNVDNCIVNSNNSPSEELCQEIGCVWCASNGQETCKRNTYPDTCKASPAEACPVPNLTSLSSCKSWGCEWCGPAGQPSCRKSTDCISCLCSNPVSCNGTTARACGELGCLWCENGTKAGKCINMNSGGLTAKTAGSWTDCTRECDCGTRFRFKACNNSNPLSCEREYQTCNNHSCPSDVCIDGVRPRYQETTLCCQNHTHACGRNFLNEDRPPSPSQSRRKRIVGGSVIVTIEKWPWLAVVYFNLSSTSATRCSGTLVGDKWVITAASCVLGNDETDSVVNLDVYDRNEAPGVTRMVERFHVHSDMNIALVELKDTVTPYSKCVSPLCMPYDEIAKRDRRCVVAGWGRTVANNVSSCTAKAQDVNVRVMERQLCEQAWGASFNPMHHFCAGIPEGEKDACTGDEGGPLMCQRCEDCGWFLAGVASNLLGCGSSQKPSLYFNIVGEVEDWVHTVFTRLDQRNYASCDPKP